MTWRKPSRPTFACAGICNKTQNTCTELAAREQVASDSIILLVEYKKLSSHTCCCTFVVATFLALSLLSLPPSHVDARPDEARLFRLIVDASHTRPHHCQPELRHHSYLVGTRGHEDRGRRSGPHLGRARLAPECGRQLFLSVAPTVVNAHDTITSPARLCLRKRTTVVVIPYCTILELFV